MFLGEYKHSLDAKGRVILPAKFRDQLADGAFVTKGRDGCLFVYTPEEFEAVADQVREAARRSDQQLEAARSFFAGAAEVVADKQGRIPIPQTLREYAELERDITLVGVYTRIEIWDTHRWEERERIGEQALASGKNLADFGI